MLEASNAMMFNLMRKVLRVMRQAPVAPAPPAAAAVPGSAGAVSSQGSDTDGASTQITAAPDA